MAHATCPLLSPACLIGSGRTRRKIRRLLWEISWLIPAFPKRELEKIVRVGDPVSFAQMPIELGETMIAGHSMDNRASVAAVTHCLRELQHVQHGWDVWSAATTQEEETLAGAFTSPFMIRPAIAVAVDVTFGRMPGVSDYRSFPLGKGPTIGLGPNIHPVLQKRFKKLAEELDIPFAMEVMPQHSGTDAYAMQVVAEGIPTAVIGIPSTQHAHPG